MATKMLHGVSVELTEEELAEHLAAQAKAQETKQAMKAAQAVKDAKLASGKAKLKELGLDDDEISQIVGI